jgi:23S rRNA pseudouridine1911/1915/1917 synthase
MAYRFSSESFESQSAEALPLDRVLKLRYPEASWNEVRRLITSGKVSVGDKRITDGRTLVAAGTQLKIAMTTPRALPGTVDDKLVVFCDGHVVVVRKPEGISSIIHEIEPTSVEQQVRDWLSVKEKRRVAPLGIVHRLDKVTSGVMVFARNPAAKAFLKDQFRAHTVGRTYLAIVHGHVREGRLAFRIVRDRGDGLRGVTQDPRYGSFSATNIEVVEPMERCSLIRCRLETGRTHQIRIHLSYILHPIVGEPLYTAGYAGTLLQAPRVMLHAATLSFEHPAHRGRMSFDEPLPSNFEQFLARERARGQ